MSNGENAVFKLTENSYNSNNKLITKSVDYSIIHKDSTLKSNYTIIYDIPDSSLIIMNTKVKEN